MPTTTRSSDCAGPRAATSSRQRLAVTALLWLAGCASPPATTFFQLAPAEPEHKAAQTRMFETHDATELLSASAAVFQDLGFHIEESVRDLGFLRAAKERSARETGQEVSRVLMIILSLGHLVTPVDLEQKIAATLVARPLDAAATRHEVRVMFYRIVWKGEGQSNNQPIPPGQQRLEMIRDPAIYQQFFAKLSKAVFLEPFTL